MTKSDMRKEIMNKKIDNILFELWGKEEKLTIEDFITINEMHINARKKTFKTKKDTSIKRIKKATYNELISLFVEYEKILKEVDKILSTY